MDGNAWYGHPRSQASPHRQLLFATTWCPAVYAAFRSSGKVRVDEYIRDLPSRRSWLILLCSNGLVVGKHSWLVTEHNFPACCRERSMGKIVDSRSYHKVRLNGKSSNHESEIAMEVRESNDTFYDFKSKPPAWGLQHSRDWVYRELTEQAAPQGHRQVIALTLSVSAMNQKRMDCLEWQRRRGPELHREQRGKGRRLRKDATAKDCTGKQIYVRARTVIRLLTLEARVPGFKPYWVARSTIPVNSLLAKASLRFRASRIDPKGNFEQAVRVSRTFSTSHFPESVQGPVKRDAGSRMPIMGNFGSPSTEDQ
ncbi:hypothetical protein BGW80DRAFT_1254497 [Lactifluus volemus]|nr:hypothetical protein BGW80DRAFT_1254497 [Lactifluus volemus]